MSLAEIFLTITMLYLSTCMLIYFYAKRSGKSMNLKKIWPIGFLFICMLAFSLNFFNYPHINIRQLILILLIFLWSISLTIEINKRSKIKKNLHPKPNLLLIIKMGLFQLLVSAPIISINFIPGPNWINYLDIFAISLGFMAIFLQIKSYRELSLHLKYQAKDKFFKSKLRISSRNPGVLGEFFFWTSLYLISISSINGYMSIYGPLIFIIYQLNIFLPRHEDKLSKRFKEFEEYKKLTGAVFPKITK